MMGYTERKELHVKVVLEEAPSKHNFVTRAHFLSEVNEEVFSNCCDAVRNHKNNADFVLIKLIRFLYITDESLRTYQDYIMNILSTFSFWPRRADSNHSDASMTNQPIGNVCYWSENHIFMYLSSAHLFGRKIGRRLLYEECLLLIYLTAHCNFEGVYEVNSAVYLPYTMASMLNLFDFSPVLEIREKALFLMDKILSQLLLVCNRDGICTLSASARQYPRNRFRNYDHNINQVIRLLTGSSADVIQSSAITSFFLTSTFHPSILPSANGNEDQWLQKCLQFCGFKQVRMNHPTSETRSIYLEALSSVICDSTFGNLAINELDLTPCYWSAGLITHPRFVDDSKRYLQTLSLSRAPGVKLLNYVPQLFASYLMEEYSIYAAGQNYSGVILNVYKSPNGGVVMSSFDKYNVNLRSYQQNPWMVNFVGAPLWSQSGRFGKFGLPGFNSYCPAVSQKKNMMAISYAAPSSREGFFCNKLFGLYDNSSFMVWPRCYFDEEFVVEKGKTIEEYQTHEISHSENNSLPEISEGGVWWVARRQDSFLGLLCSHQTSEVLNCTDAPCLHIRPLPPSSREIGNFPPSDESVEGCPDALKISKSFSCLKMCSAPNHTWIICVGDTSLYPSIDSFIRHCAMDVSFHQSESGGKYDVEVVEDCHVENSQEKLHLNIMK